MNSGSPSILKRIKSLGLNVDVRMGGGRMGAGAGGVGFWEGLVVGAGFVEVVVVGCGVASPLTPVAPTAVVGLGHKDPGVDGEGRKEVALVLTEYLSSSVSRSRSRSRDAQLSEVEVVVVVDAREALDGRRSCG